MDEHRISQRVRSFLRGEIVHSQGASRTECTIRDLSESGARLEAPPSVTVPEFFDLVIPARSLQRRVQIVWRHGSEIGIRFIMENQPPQAAPKPTGADPELNTRVLQLEAETAKLRSQLMEMQLALQTLMQERRAG